MYPEMLKPSGGSVKSETFKCFFRESIGFFGFFCLTLWANSERIQP